MRPSVLSAVNVGLWSLLFCESCSLLARVNDRHVAGYPTHGQLIYYMGVPLVVALTNIATFIISFRPRPSAAILAVNLLCLFSIAPFLLSYSGGV